MTAPDVEQENLILSAIDAVKPLQTSDPRLLTAVIMTAHLHRPEPVKDKHGRAHLCAACRCLYPCQTARSVADIFQMRPDLAKVPAT